jgi:hypothetical protein
MLRKTLGTVLYIANVMSRSAGNFLAPNQKARLRSAETKLRFATHVLNNIQELIRFIDQKSGLILIIASLLSTGYLAIMNIYFSQTRVSFLEDLLMVILIAWFLIRISLVIWYALWVFVPRLGPMTNRSGAPEMFFPLMILRKFNEDDKRYYAKLDSTTESDHLADYSQQIVATSAIYRAKHRNLNHALDSIFPATLAWVVGLLTATCSKLLSLLDDEWKIVLLCRFAIALIIVGSIALERFRKRENLVPGLGDHYFLETRESSDSRQDCADQGS